jgi:hypothetical protein
VIYGHVLLGDSDRAARFAKVLLKPVAPPDPADDFLTVLVESALVNMQSKSSDGSVGGTDASEMSRARSSVAKLLGDAGDMLVASTVNADGGYTFSGVGPGSYYVRVKAAGYIDPLCAFSDEELASQDPAVRKKIAAVATIVTVHGNEHVRADMRLQRGAALIGRVRYDDGSPAAGWTVRAVPAKAQAADPLANFMGFDLNQIDPAHSSEFSTTDDLGQFRISGLPGGEFVLEARLTTAALDHSPFEPVASSAGSFLSIVGGMSSMSGLKLTVYSGNATRLSAAKKIDVREGEERNVPDMQVDLQSTHSIGGVLVAKADGHPINGGSMELIAQDDNGNDDPSLRLSATIHSDGSFRFDYVPGPGRFMLRSAHAADMSTVSTMKILGSLIAERKTNRNYAATSVPVSVGDEDILDLRVLVPDPNATQ